MPRKKQEKKNGIETFLKAWLYGDDVALGEAFRAEASRQVGEMVKWMKDQEENDPIGMLHQYEEEIFPMIRQAMKFRFRIYDRNKKFPDLEHQLRVAEFNKDTELSAKLAEDWFTLDAERIALCWRIKRIHIKVVHLVNLDVDTKRGETNPFEEYVYDPEKW